MAERMLKFTVIDRRTPEKRAASARDRDFQEIYADFIDAKAAEQASRCSQCGIPFCQTHCPLHNNIPDWLRMTAAGRLEEAYQLSQATNAMPEICGRICPQDRLCEGNCVIEQSGHGTVTIGAVERYINDKAWEEGWVAPLVQGPSRGQSVGVVGAGPAGLSAAERLFEMGYDVTVYDRYDRPGGLLVYGIPGFKLEKDVVARRTDRLADGGIVFKLNFEVGRDATLEDLRRTHDAVLLATGVYAAKDLPVPGAGSAGVVAALDYLTASNRKGYGDAVPAFDSGELDAQGKNVVVVGGGDTAMDCRAHRDPPGRGKRHLPLPPRPGEHAGIPARGAERRGRGRGVRMAGRASRGDRRRRPRRRRAGRPHAAGPRRRLGPPEPRADRERRLRDQG